MAANGVYDVTLSDPTESEFTDDWRSDESRAMRKDKPKPKLVASRHVGEDPARMIAEFSASKKQTDMTFPFGGQISVPPGTLGKRDVITCCVVSPSERFKYQPTLGPGEHILSEIFLVSISCKTIKKGHVVTLCLPHYEEDTELYTLAAKHKQVDGDWTEIPCTFDSDKRWAQLETDCGGIYVITSSVKREQFEVPVQGCLYNAKIHHQISVRFPKKTVDVPIDCHISVIPLNRNIVAKLRNEYPIDMADLITASDFYDVRAHTDKTFRRSVTVKLPLPPLDNDNFNAEDMAIMMWSGDSWTVYEAPLKFVKNAASFDTRQLSKFCLALAKPQRKKRLKEAFRHIERENTMCRGDVIPFIHIQDKLWTLFFDVASTSRIGPTIDKRLQQGFRQIKKSYLPEIPTEEEEKQMARRSWRTKSAKPEEKLPDREDLDLINGGHFEVEIGGDIHVAEGEVGHDNFQLFYLDRSPDNYRRYYVEPDKLAEGRILTAFLKCYMTDANGKRQCVKTFDFDVGPETVAAFHYVEPEPEPEPEEPEYEEPEVIRPETPPPTAPAPEPVRPTQHKPMNMASFNRLTKPSRPPKQVFREPRVLTGRSLRTLAREVEQGLTLAIHLDISDSTITGMGFDALANGLSLVDITYKILLLWKRRSSGMKDRQVAMLIEAMEEMGRKDLADVIRKQNDENQEITPECLQSAHAE